MSAVEPAVSLAEAQAFLRIDSGDEEGLLAGLVRSATALCESFIGQLLIVRPFTVQTGTACGWNRLPVSPVRSIETVESLDAQGVATALPASGFSIDIDASGDGWVRLSQPGSATLIRVSGTAGMAAVQSDVPEPIRHGILRLVAHLFNERDGPGGQPPAAVTALWRPYRRARLT